MGEGECQLKYLLVEHIVRTLRTKESTVDSSGHYFKTDRNTNETSNEPH